MAQIKGITVKLIKKIQTGVDDFNRPTYEEEEINVTNVLVTPTSSKEVLETLNLTGRKAVYTLAIPKKDNNIWEGQKVEFFGKTWCVIGIPVLGIEENIPLDWNLKAMVERYGDQS